MPPDAPQGSSRRAILTVAIAAIALETALLGLIAPLLPEIEERTGAGDAALGLALAAYAIPILVVSIPTGRLADRIGRRPLLLGGLVLTGVGSLLIAFSDSLEVLLAGRAVQGLGSTASWVAALALVSDLARPGRKGEAIGFALAANSGGAVAGPALGGIAGGAISYEAPFLLVTAIAAGMFTAGYFILPRGKPQAAAAEGVPGTARRGVLSALFKREALVPGAVAVAGAAFLGMVDFTVPLDLDRRLGTTEIAIGLLFAAAASLDAIASPVAGGASDRRGRRPVVIVGALVVATSGFLLAALGTLAGAAIGLIVFGVGQSIVFAGAVPWLDETFGEFDRGLAYGGLNLVYATGYTIGPLVGGWLLAEASADAAYLLMAGVALAGVAMLAAGREPRH
ncbi:MAG: MFS transporter [Actinomycetota bacterium]|nr:MFS transporter [Actinomycetota bacterium]